MIDIHIPQSAVCNIQTPAVLILVVVLVIRVALDVVVSIFAKISSCTNAVVLKR